MTDGLISQADGARLMFAAKRWVDRALAGSKNAAAAERAFEKLVSDLTVPEWVPQPSTDNLGQQGEAGEP